MTKMKAIGFTKNTPFSNSDSFVEFETDMPTPRARDIVVKILATSINPIDVKTYQSQEKELDTPKIIGFDAVGIVYETGSATTKFKVGDKVYYSGSYLRMGSFAEFQAVDERIVSLAPKNLSDAEIASIPLTFLTAYESLVEKMHLKFEDQNLRDKIILIINGAGGVGSAAIQLARLSQIKIVATASRKETANWIKNLGADLVIDHHENLENQLMNAGALGVDYVLELHNLTEYFEQITNLINPLGTVVSTTNATGITDFTDWKRKSVSFAWEWMFARSFYGTTDMSKQGEILAEIAKLLDAKKIRPTMTTVLKGFSAKNIRAGMQLVADNKMIGKVVISFE